MKSKKSIYILLPLVLGIWGMVLYQFFSFGEEEQPQTSLSSDLTAALPITNLKIDTSDVDVNFRDPFLGREYRAASVNHSANKAIRIKSAKKNKPAPKVKEALVWPEIKYKGIVSDTKNKKKVFMVLIAGRTYLMKIGSTENEVTLVEGDRETIDVKYKGEVNLIVIED